jgi:hypothetical protein
VKGEGEKKEMREDLHGEEGNSGITSKLCN